MIFLNQGRVPRAILVLALLLAAKSAFAQKVENLSQIRLSVGQNFDSIESQASNADFRIQKKESFYSLNLASTWIRKTAVSIWSYSLMLENGQAFTSHSNFQQANLSSSYTLNDVRDTLSLGLTSSANQGDLNYRRPLLSQTGSEVSIQRQDSRYYAIQGSYAYALTPFTKLTTEAQSSLFDQKSTHVQTHRLTQRLQHMIDVFWDTGIAVTGTEQSLARNPLRYRSVELTWNNNFRPSFQDVIMQSAGFIQTMNGPKKADSSTFGLTYAHLFDNNTLFQIDTGNQPAEAKKSGDAQGNPTLDSSEQEKMLMEKLRQIQLRNLLSFYWLRSLSALEDGNQQFVSEQYGSVYDYSHSQGHDVQVSLSQSAQFDREKISSIQRLDRTFRAAYARSFQLFNSYSSTNPDRLSMEYQYQWTEEKTLQLLGRHWLVMLAFETRF